MTAYNVFGVNLTNCYPQSLVKFDEHDQTPVTFSKKAQISALLLETLTNFVPTQLKATQLVVALAVWATQRSDPDFTEATTTLLMPIATSLACHWTTITLLS